MTDQELADKVLTSLRLQGRPSGSVFDAYSCAYRRFEEDGTVLKCAAGWLIQDEVYDPMIEGAPVLSVGQTQGLPPATGPEQVAARKKVALVQDALIASGVNLDQLELVAAMQGMHDEWHARLNGRPDWGTEEAQAEERARWEDEMRACLEARGLHYSPPAGPEVVA